MFVVEKWRVILLNKIGARGALRATMGGVTLFKSLPSRRRSISRGKVGRERLICRIIVMIYEAFDETHNPTSPPIPKIHRRTKLEY